MLPIFIDNKRILVVKSSTILEACNKIGILIPRFCYYERLNVAGNCRMCLVEVEKTPKPVVACAFPVVNNMRIFTNSPLVKKARENILEFLLLNHPLDCPICDQAGECDLQEETMFFGSDHSRFIFSKRFIENKNCSFLIKTIMTRCIHCTRCIRFLETVGGYYTFGTTLRGKKTEVGTFTNKQLSFELSGNLIDLCPVGALTSKPYAFSYRPWEIKQAETFDISDAIGSSIKINFKEMELLRILPTTVNFLNEEWISDKTRFSFDGLSYNRIGYPYLMVDCNNSHSFKIGWNLALKKFNKTIRNFKENEVLFIVGNNLDLLTLQFLKIISFSLNISLINEDFLNFNNNLSSNFKFNVTFSDILKCDFILLFGTNVRFEASLLNVRLKKRIANGNFFSTSIGLTDNLTYLNIGSGNSFNTFIDLIEGRHFVCKKIVKSNYPLVIFGYSIMKRLDSSSIFFLLKNLSKFCNLINEKWFGINFLSLSSNFVGKSLLGLKSNDKTFLKNKKFVYLIGVDKKYFYQIFEKKNIFVIAHHTSYLNFFKKLNMILPATTFVEKNGWFVNLEGQLQKTNKILNSPNLARDVNKVVSLLFFRSLKFISTKSTKFNLLVTNKSKFCFSKKIFFNHLVLNRFFKTSFRSVVPNFFSTNIITKNSIVMNKCASFFKRNYINFKKDI